MIVALILLSMSKPTTLQKFSTGPSVARFLMCAMSALVSLVVITALFDSGCHPKFQYGFFSPYFSLILLIIYLWQFAILRSHLSWRAKQTCFAIVLAVSLPFIYWRCFPVPTIEVGTLTHVLANSVWVLPVPIATFYLLGKTSLRDLSENRLAALASRIILAVFAWTVIWSSTLMITGLAANWTNNFSAC